MAAGILVLAIASTTGCGSVASGSASSTSARNVTLRVFAAASLTAAFQKIGTAFEQAHPGVKVSFNFAGSQALAQQITQGAPADVFASADAQQMLVAQRAGDVSASAEQVFVHNKLVAIYPAANPGHVRSLHDLANPGLKVVLAASAVPVGHYSLVFLDHASADPSYGPSYKQHVLANVVSYEENVKAVLAKVQLGEADAGIVYTSDIAGLGDKIGQVSIPDALNPIASYPIAPVTGSAHASLAREFIQMVLGALGQRTLAEYGFAPVAQSAATPSATGYTATDALAFAPVEDWRNG